MFSNYLYAVVARLDFSFGSDGEGVVTAVHGNAGMEQVFLSHQGIIQLERTVGAVDTMATVTIVT